MTLSTGMESRNWKSTSIWALSILMMALVLRGGDANAGAAALSDASLVGTWDCGPTSIDGPSFDLVTTERNSKKADHSFSTFNTWTMKSHDGQSAVVTFVTQGSWHLDGDVVTSTARRVDVVSSTSPTLTKEKAQLIQEAQLRKNPVLRVRIVHFDGRTARSEPLGQPPGAPVVVSTCRRVRSRK